MTDEQIKAVVAKYIIGGYEDDNADCLHERDEFYNMPDDDPDELLKRAYQFYRTAKVTVTWDDPEGGVSGPAGSGSDPKTPGATGLPVPGGEFQPTENLAGVS